MTIPTERRLALAVRLDAIDPSLISSVEAVEGEPLQKYSTIETLIEIASEALDECQKLERLLTDAPTKIIVQGNPIDGFTMYGPIDEDDIDRASERIEPDWWVATLLPPPA
jgi:hypothetical protein